MCPAFSDLEIKRLPANPIISPTSHPAAGNNINGPSLIRVPEWVKEPLGRYYLYFAHHKGKSIRLAYSDSIEGPYRWHEPGALALEDSLFPVEIHQKDLPEKVRTHYQSLEAAGDNPFYAHIASPDAITVPEAEEIRLYYHGMLPDGRQATRVAVSKDGLGFEPLPEIITRPYLRMFQYENHWYGMAMPGVFYRSVDGLTKFEQGPSLFNQHMRHAALMIHDDLLLVFWTQVGDTPERILLSSIRITDSWHEWQASEPIEVLRPETLWEGADLPLEPSVRGATETPANQLRDPAIYSENGKIWLLYAVAGEYGIGISEVTLPI